MPEKTETLSFGVSSSNLFEGCFMEENEDEEIDIGLKYDLATVLSLELDRDFDRDSLRSHAELGDVCCSAFAII